MLLTLIVIFGFFTIQGCTGLTMTQCRGDQQRRTTVYLNTFYNGSTSNEGSCFYLQHVWNVTKNANLTEKEMDKFHDMVGFAEHVLRYDDNPFNMMAGLIAFHEFYDPSGFQKIFINNISTWSFYFRPIYEYMKIDTVNNLDKLYTRESDGEYAILKAIKKHVLGIQGLSEFSFAYDSLVEELDKGKRIAIIDKLIDIIFEFYKDKRFMLFPVKFEDGSFQWFPYTLWLLRTSNAYQMFETGPDNEIYYFKYLREEVYENTDNDIGYRITLNQYRMGALQRLELTQKNDTSSENRSDIVSCYTMEYHMVNHLTIRMLFAKKRPYQPYIVSSFRELYF